VSCTLRFTIRYGSRGGGGGGKRRRKKRKADQSEEPGPHDGGRPFFFVDGRAGPGTRRGKEGGKTQDVCRKTQDGGRNRLLPENQAGPKQRRGKRKKGKGWTLGSMREQLSPDPPPFSSSGGKKERRWYLAARGWLRCSLPPFLSFIAAWERWKEGGTLQPFVTSLFRTLAPAGRESEKREEAFGGEASFVSSFPY